MLQHLRSGKLPAAVTLILLGLLVIDLFVLEKKKVYEIVDNGTIDTQYNKEKDEEDIYYLITKTHRHIRVNRLLYNTILIDDTISTSQTPLFNRIARISWRKEDGLYYQNINPMNMSYFSDILLAVLLASALLRLLNLQKLDGIIDYLVLVFSAGLLLYYLNN